jgi:hypothetical protein
MRNIVNIVPFVPNVRNDLNILYLYPPSPFLMQSNWEQRLMVQSQAGTKFFSIGVGTLGTGRLPTRPSLQLQNSKCYEQTQHLVENKEGCFGKPSKFMKNKLVISANPASN